MAASRLRLALDAGVIRPPQDGLLAVVNPTPADDLAALPSSRIKVICRRQPEIAQFIARGVDAAPVIGGAADWGLVMLPRARAQGRAWVAAMAALLPAGAEIAVDGDKLQGIDTMLHDLRQRAEVGPPFSKAHGNVLGFVNPGAAAFADWDAGNRPTRNAAGFLTLPGVFSADGADPGSVLLAAALPDSLPPRVADLGSGWGYLAAAALARPGIAALHLVEADHDADLCARLNITDPRAAFHWADATSFTPPGGPLDAVIMNPPFHQGRAADPGLGAAFIRQAARLLRGSGWLLMVANRHLPYEAVLASVFRDVQELGGSGAFKVLRASHPVTGSTRPAAPARRRR